MKNIISAFTKPWPDLSIEELADKLNRFGFTGVELCVRKGYQVYSESNLANNLSKAVSVFKERGISVVGIGGDLNEMTMSSCAEAGIPYIRTLMSLPRCIKNIKEELDNCRRKIEEKIKIAEKYKVIIGIQEHVDTYAYNTLLLYHIVKDFSSDYVKAIWDSAQSLMAGESYDFGLSFILPYCCSVQLKNIRFKNPGVEFIRGEDGIIPWRNVLTTLKDSQYSGNITLTHEYSDISNIEESFKADSSYANCLVKEVM